MAQGDLTTLASVREFLRISDAKTDMDDVLASFITQASAAIKRHTGREFAAESTASQTRLFAYRGGGRLYFAMDGPRDLRTASTVTIDTDTDNPTVLVEDEDYFLFPRGGGAGGVYEHMELRWWEPASKLSSDQVKPWREIEIVGTWGWASVPSDVIAATNMLVAFWYRQHSAVPGNDLAGEGDRFGPVAFPTSVLRLLEPYRVMGFGYGA